MCVLRTELASLPKNITVKVTGYEIGGAMVPAGAPCMDQMLGSCQQVVKVRKVSVDSCAIQEML